MASAKNTSLMEELKKNTPGFMTAVLLQVILVLSVLVHQTAYQRTPVLEHTGVNTTRIEATKESVPMLDELDTDFWVPATNELQLTFWASQKMSVNDTTHGGLPGGHGLDYSSIHTSTELCFFDLVAGTAKVLETDTEAAYTHYCSHDDLQYIMGIEGFEDDCQSYTSVVVGLPECPLPSVPDWDFEDANPPQGNEQDIQARVMNDLLEAHLAYLLVILNISAMEENHICRLDHELGQDCDADKVCNSLRSKNEIEFYCDTHALISDVQFEMKQLINDDITVMKLLSIPIEVDVDFEIYPPGDIKEGEMRHYTLGGIYNTLELAVNTVHAMDYICSYES